MELMPATTAVLTMELQRGVCGDLAPNRHLADAVAEAGLVESTARLLETARRFGATVVHCTFGIRPDGRGTNFALPLMSAAAKDDRLLRIGDPSAEIIPALVPHEGDLVVARGHGVAPFTGTALDATLRHLGVDAVVITGVSLNVGVIGAAVEAVGLGYRVVIPTDAVVGVPVDYGRQVVKNALAYIAELTTVDDLIAPWK
jgi:nicotinamidase-related amidase